MFQRGLDPKTAMGIGIKLTEKEIQKFIKTQLSINRAWAIKAMLKIYDFQTAFEQKAAETHETNKVGFTGADAEILTSFVNQYKTRAFLSPKQMVLVYKKMPKYWNQIYKISDKIAIDSLIRKSLTATSN